MSRHPADASPEYHRAMATTYLYNATRSLASSDGQLDGFKLWAKDVDRENSIGPFLEALAGWHIDKVWPWQESDSTPGPQGARIDEPA